MLMVVFGAGASYGSDPTFASPPALDRPPLTNELISDQYEPIAAKYPPSRPAILRLRNEMGAGGESPLLEAEIAKLYEQAVSDPERGRHLLALRFYLDDLIRLLAQKWWEGLFGFTNYGTLLERLGTWRRSTGEPIALVTFNYDELLDRSVEGQVGNWTLNDFPAYVNRPDWRLYKLHGSTAWSRVYPDPLPVDRDNANDVIAGAGGIDFEQHELRHANWRAAARSVGVGAAVPGIAVPTNLKQTFSCPPTHVSAFTTDLRQVTRLIVIGWKATEPHAVKLLDQVPDGCRVAVCDVDEAAVTNVRVNLGRVAASASYFASLQDEFSGLVGGDWLERWLTS